MTFMAFMAVCSGDFLGGRGRLAGCPVRWAKSSRSRSKRQVRWIRLGSPERRQVDPGRPG